MNEEYQELFDLMYNEHGLILLESEMDEIITVVSKFLKLDDETSQQTIKGKV